MLPSVLAVMCDVGLMGPRLSHKCLENQVAYGKCPIPTLSVGTERVNLTEFGKVVWRMCDLEDDQTRR